MHSLVKKIELLELPAAAAATLERRAAFHLRYSAIDFKVLEARADGVVIRVRQLRSHAENYFEKKRLIEILHETFDDLLPGRKVEPRPYPYAPAPPDVVDAAWLQQQRGQTPIKTIAADLGMDPNMVSGYMRGLRPISGVVRAMFYWYFKCH